MSKKLPNFLLVGAAKCGTSSLHKYLDQHPEIFMSKHKEPRFISSQATPFPLNGPGDHKVEAWYVKNYDDYEKLFEGAGEYPAVGESSADTLYFYKGTIPVIKKYLGDPKIVIMLRNPVKRAFSAYQHLVRDLREDLSFEEGLEREPERIEACRQPRRNLGIHVRRSGPPCGPGSGSSRSLRRPPGARRNGSSA